MEIIKVSKENLEKEHICCAISNNKDCQVASKKEWLDKRFDEGLVFLKGNVRGKCFIEYVPAENAWVPIEAEGYMYIDCLWVSGQFKGQGYSNDLLGACIKDAKDQNKNGLVVISSKKKMPYMSDYKYLLHKGFQIVDSAEPFYELMCLKFNDDAKEPKFMEHVKTPSTNKDGFVLYYSAQCPFTAKYVPIIEEIAKEKGIQFEGIKIKTTDEARKAPCISTTYSLFYNGKFVTNEILSGKKFEKIISEVI